MKEIFSKWEPAKRLLTTRLGGDVDLNDVEYWKKTLKEAAAQIEPDTRFKAFVNLYDFKAVDLTAHKAMREVIPLFLAMHNFKAGYVDLFEEASLILSSKNGIVCVAAAHVHNNVEKISLFREKFGRDAEQFFTNPEQGKKWIEKVDINGVQI